MPSPFSIKARRSSASLTHQIGLCTLRHEKLAHECRTVGRRLGGGIVSVLRTKAVQLRIDYPRVVEAGLLDSTCNRLPACSGVGIEQHHAVRPSASSQDLLRIVVVKPAPAPCTPTARSPLRPRRRSVQYPPELWPASTTFSTPGTARSALIAAGPGAEELPRSSAPRP